MTNDNNSKAIADAMLAAALRREAARKEMAATRWMPATVKVGTPRRNRRTSVRHRAIR